jgi:DNA methyltransferase 1-associated protein 1
MGDVAQILGVTAASSSEHRNDELEIPSFTSTKKLPRAVKFQRLPKEVLDLVAGSGNSSHQEAALELPTAVPSINAFSNKTTRILDNSTATTATGNNAIAASGDTTTVVKVGNRWISTNKPVRSWRWAPFTSSARNDGLVLHHWVRSNVEYLDYPYARFNIHLDTVSYDTHNDSTSSSSVNEYRALQLHTDPNWSKSETDLLLEFARRYELRWPVIYDRWIEMFGCPSDSENIDGNTYGGNRFQIEDLQHRYYTVAALINQSRITTEAEYEARSLALQTNAASAALAKTSTTTGSSYPKNNSSDTTSSLPSTESTVLVANTAGHISNQSNTNDAESEIMKQRAVETLLIETAAARALATTEPEYQPLIQNIGSGTSNKVAFDLHKERERRQHMEALWNRSKAEELEEIELRNELKQIEVQLRKLKKSGAHIAAAAAAAAATTTGVSSATSASRVSTPIQFVGSSGGSPKESVAVDPNTLPAILDKAFSTTASTAEPIVVAGTPYLQSCRLLPPGIGDGTTINQALLSRMNTVLDELNIPQDPIPTKRVCDVYDTLRKDILTLLILQKEVLKKEGILAKKHLHLAKKSGNTHVDDEERLLGIPPPKPSSPTIRAPSSATASGTGGSGKGSRNAKTGKADGPKKKANTTPKSGAVATGDMEKSDRATGPNNPGKTTSGGKQPRKVSAPGTKRKRKSDESGPKPIIGDRSDPVVSTTSRASIPLVVPSTAASTIRSGAVTNSTGNDNTATTKPTAGVDTTTNVPSIPASTTAPSQATSAATAALTPTVTDIKASAKKRAKKGTNT